jgi:hypothetical protein
MKNIITGIALFSFPYFAFAELNIASEFLIGKTQNKVHSSIQTEVSEDHYSSSLKSDSLGLRLGIDVTDNFAIELSKHDHGDVVNNFTISIPTMAPPSPSGPIFLPPELDTIVEARIPIDLESLRVGVKGQMEIFEKVSVNARLGLAHWSYGEFTPQQLTNVGASSSSGESGNDLYYSFGAEYKFTENFYLGFEYSLFTINESSGDKNSVSGSYKHDVKDLSLVLGWAF